MIIKIKKIIHKVLHKFGYSVAKISKTSFVDPRLEGFDRYLSAAQQANLDVNDYLESVLAWEEALPVINKACLPHRKAGRFLIRRREKGKKLKL